jgi:hypothetical protein
MFATRRAHTVWNARYAGKTAGAVTPRGYLSISISKTRFMAHRLAWLLHHGEPVPEIIDHTDRRPLNNRIANLRPATTSQNLFNAKTPLHNTSGVKGVSPHRTGGFQMQIWAAGKYYGRHFRTLEEATAARREAAIRLHGEFVRHH